MDYAVTGVALGGWQLIDLGLMGAIGVALLGLSFLKVVLILLGALLCATGPLTIGLVPGRASKRRIKTPCVATAEAARNARADLLAKIQRGETAVTGGLRLTEARTQFVATASEGKALNKQGRRYKPRAIDDIDEASASTSSPPSGPNG